MTYENMHHHVNIRNANTEGNTDMEQSSWQGKIGSIIVVGNAMLPVFHKLEGHKEKDEKQLSLSMPYAPSADDGSLRMGKPEFIVPPLCVCVFERA